MVDIYHDSLLIITVMLIIYLHTVNLTMMQNLPIRYDIIHLPSHFPHPLFWKIYHLPASIETYGDKIPNPLLETDYDPFN